ncbi:MAG: metallophosphoesterase [Chloroflexota bacterium]|nr:MAG: hypothetical protein DLM70_09020 [Chloroflexota bacterium]
MSIWAIADIHASRTDQASGRPTKPMDVFGDQWSDHLMRLLEAWQHSVGDDDTVIVAGDTDWALHLDEAMETLERLDRLKGRKILIRGNHDYWWSSKVTNKVRKRLPASLQLIHNDALVAESVNICGAKGSPVPGGMEWTPENEKLLHREQQRLEVSLDARDPSLPTITALHYPPYYPSLGDSPYKDILEREHVGLCVYGHLHGPAAQGGPTGSHDGVDYRLVAGDAVAFRPVLIAREGRLMSQDEIQSHA